MGGAKHSIGEVLTMYSRQQVAWMRGGTRHPESLVLIYSFIMFNLLQDVSRF